jgi:PGF-pre-PGF domain-containing protein
MKNLAVLAILVSSLSLCIAEATDLTFTGAGTQYLYVPVNYANVRAFSFNISGSTYSGTLPSNITIDIGDDGTTEWQYNPYHSTTILQDYMVWDSWSHNPGTGRIYIQSGINNGASGTSLGSISNNDYQRNDIEEHGNIGIRTNDAINEQILSITTNTTTAHAFLPALSPVGTAGLYIAQGGSTYYCNSDHTFFLTQNCDLTPAQAATANHIARKANITGYNLTEPVGNARITEAVNKQLSGCQLPCNIILKVTSATPGIVSLEDFKTTGPLAAATITMQETTNSYQISITPQASLTSVKYGYLAMPKAYIVPFVAGDDTTTLESGQMTRLNSIINNLAIKWDELTNYSHPINFTYYMSPLSITGYNMGQSFYNFSIKAEETFLNQTDAATPGILVILDIKDYFPNKEPHNTITTLDNRGIISTIYMNGFSDSNSITGLYRYDDEILTNILLHELAHTFIIYPANDQLFYSGHPASFTSISGFNTYQAAQSPTGSQGYYEIYSILNQIRPFITEAEIGQAPQLSYLDRMLLGTLSPYTESDYTFYSGTITKNSDRYQSSSMTASHAEDANSLYAFSLDSNWWDARTNSSFTPAGTSQAFSVAKSGQKNRALMVFANDLGHPEHFKVFNANSQSVSSTTSPVPFVELIAPGNAATSTSNSAAFVCRSYNGQDNLTLYTDTSGSWQAIASTNLNKINHTITGIPDGIYRWNCKARLNSQERWASSNRTITISYTPAPAAYCGDNTCNNNEKCDTCSKDCGECPKSSGGGGGGGSGGGGTGPNSKSKFWQTITPGQYSMGITGADFAVTEIAFASGANAKSVTLTLKKLSGKPSYTANLTGKVFKYMDITLTNLDASNLSGKARIKFDVQTSWLAANKIEPRDIALFRYVANQWIELPTIATSSTSETVSYQSESPGFSHYAIVGKTGPTIIGSLEVPKPGNKTQEIGNEATINATKPTKTAKQNGAPVYKSIGAKKKTDDKMKYHIAAALIATAMIAVTIMLLIRKKKITEGLQ